MNEKKTFMIFDYYLIEKAWDYALYIVCSLILLFLVAPLFAIIPLSFNSEPFFTFPMPGVSTRWYEALFASSKWQHAAQLTFGVAFSVMVIATCLGTLAALGITFADFPMKAFVIGLFLSPLMVPHLIVGLGMFFFYAWAGVVYTPWGLILAHTVLATPFVVLTVTATLTNFNVNLMRAGSSLGAGPIAVFFRIVLPVILPGVVGGAVLAFVASFDEPHHRDPDLRAGVQDHTAANVERSPRGVEPRGHSGRDGVDLLFDCDHGIRGMAAAAHRQAEDRKVPSRIGMNRPEFRSSLFQSALNVNTNMECAHRGGQDRSCAAGQLLPQEGCARQPHMVWVSALTG